MELDYLTAPLYDEHGNLEEVEEIHEYIASMTGEPNEDEQYYDAHEVEVEHDYDEDQYYYDEDATYYEDYEEDEEADEYDNIDAEDDLPTHETNK